MIIQITKENFEQQVINSQKTVLLDFWATWCGPCQMVAPVLEEIAAEREDIVIGKIDVDQQGELASAFGIVSIPTLIVIKDGKAVDKTVGFHTKTEILAML